MHHERCLDALKGFMKEEICELFEKDLQMWWWLIMEIFLNVFLKTQHD